MVSFSWKQKYSVTSVPLAVYLLRSQGVRNRYQQSLKQHYFNIPTIWKSLWRSSGRHSMTSVDKCIGRARRKQPDWFIDATSSG